MKLIPTASCLSFSENARVPLHFLLLLALTPGSRASGDGDLSITLPRQHLSPAELGLIINDLDPLSRHIGAYYAERRQIPEANQIHIRLAPEPVIKAEAFAEVYRQVQQQTPEQVQAYALTWAEPYRVDCMSITTGFAVGYDPAFCADECNLTRPSPYFATNSQAPYDDYRWRPTMALAGESFDEVKALIDRGIAADETRPAGTGYLVSTDDAARNVRARQYQRVIGSFGSIVRLEQVEANAIRYRPDVLFYFTGLVRVPDIDTNTYLPGAIADHVTSSGGVLTGSRQMSALRWLEAGATASYGAVVEPCNFPAKFPSPAVLIANYLNGATAIEAYWKSVAMPGQGIFIGEPLARPYGGYALEYQAGEDDAEGDHWRLTTYALSPGRYRLESALDPLGPYEGRGTFVKKGAAPAVLELPVEGAPVYRILPASP
ncbi:MULTISPECIES: TIGR03790 family protein [Thiorhodovibrio]|uniref:TIGR03790 family protein n=1 Tax=Thiorhodovibrio TaxID=61593 RepID=UPI00191295C1|nr:MULTISPECIES: TIGR03790 family protein [Thiorhodovibrio]MBK5970777.1 TIGR03790 family protein [Thiorhodovibrio winogradskyi]